MLVIIINTRILCSKCYVSCCESFDSVLSSVMCLIINVLQINRAACDVR